MIYKTTEVNLGLIKVNAMDRSAGFHFSTSYLKGRYSQTSKNQGYGENNGDRNTFYRTSFFVNDDDCTDSIAIHIF